MPNTPNNGSPWNLRVAKILDVIVELDDTTTLIVAQSVGEPGQFNMLYAFGIGEIPISISRKERGHSWHTIRGVGPVSRALIKLKKGDSVCLRGPYGRGWPDISGQQVIIIAGGLGLAPLRPAIDKAINDPSCEVSILYGTRTPEMILFPDELKRWRSKAKYVAVTVDSANIDWQGHVGTVPSLLSKVSINQSNAVALVCGPEIMMRYAAANLLELVAPKDIYLSMERNMKCAIGHCGHCQWGEGFVCKDGPVYPYEQVVETFRLKDL